MRNDFDIIDDTMQERRHYPAYDEFNLWITEEHIRALRNGKALVCTDGDAGGGKSEFAAFITLKIPDDPKQAHIERHKELHAALDELFADYIRCNPNHEGSYLDMRLSTLIEWSHRQTFEPNEPREG